MYFLAYDNDTKGLLSIDLIDVRLIISIVFAILMRVEVNGYGNGIE